MDTGIERRIDLDFVNFISYKIYVWEQVVVLVYNPLNSLLLGVYKYIPMGGLYYIPLPKDILNKKVIMIPQNTDQQCFKWAIIAKQLKEENKLRVGENYTVHEDKYNFSSFQLPTSLSEIKVFEKNNQDVSVNVYGLKQKKKNPRKI